MVDLTKIKINGRYSLIDNHLFIYNGGSGFAFKMQGNGFTLNLKSIPADGYIYIIVDRNYTDKTKLLISDNISCLFNDNEPHLVDIVKVNEANDNALELVDLIVDGEFLNYDFKYQNKVVVYGDSTVAGFGILSHEGSASIHNCDAVEDLFYQALYELNMVADIFSASGYGLAFSAYTCPKNIGVIDFFNKVKVHSDILWNPDYKNDLLIVSLGCNDNSYIQENLRNKDQLIEEFETKYKKLIDSEINKNPEIKILMVYGTLTEASAYYLHEETYKYLKPFYKNLFIHKFNGDNTAISNHAFVDAHKRMAEELKKVIKEIL